MLTPSCPFCRLIHCIVPRTTGPDADVPLQLEIIRSHKPGELLTTRMVDVQDRRVVPCPLDCDYIALSYVWGGIQPSSGALECHFLPQTIENDIPVTKFLKR